MVVGGQDFWGGVQRHEGGGGRRGNYGRGYVRGGGRRLNGGEGSSIGFIYSHSRCVLSAESVTLDWVRLEEGGGGGRGCGP